VAIAPPQPGFDHHLAPEKYYSSTTISIALKRGSGISRAHNVGNLTHRRISNPHVLSGQNVSRLRTRQLNIIIIDLAFAPGHLDARQPAPLISARRTIASMGLCKVE
jgi:hypothetical protein